MTREPDTIDERRLLKKNQLVKICNFRDVTVSDLKHYRILIMKKEPDIIIVSVKTNDATSKTSRQILDNLMQLIFLKTIPNFKVII